MDKSTNTQTFENVTIDKTVLDALSAIQDYAADYYIRILDETVDCLLAESDMLGDGPESQLRRLKGLRAIRKEIERLAGLYKEPSIPVHFGLEPESEYEDDREESI